MIQHKPRQRFTTGAHNAWQGDAWQATFSGCARPGSRTHDGGMVARMSHATARAPHIGGSLYQRLGFCLAASILCSACDSTSSNSSTSDAVKPSVSASKPSDKPGGLVIPVEESQPSAPQPTAQRPKKKPEDCPAGDTLSIDNPELEQAIRLKAQKPKGDLTKADLRRLTSLNLSQAKVHELDVCLFPHMVNLKELFLGPGDLDDLSPIANATKLETLRASLNNVSDVSPLAKMTKMDRLDLGRTQVKDLSPLANMKALTELILDSTQVEDVSPLSQLTELENLSLKRTKVKDVAPLANLKHLKTIYVAETPADEDPMTFAPLRANGTKVISL